jgi:hypothetical protein
MALMEGYSWMLRSCARPADSNKAETIWDQQAE